MSASRVTLSASATLQPLILAHPQLDQLVGRAGDRACGAWLSAYSAFIASGRTRGMNDVIAVAVATAGR